MKFSDLTMAERAAIIWRVFVSIYGRAALRHVRKSDCAWILAFGCNMEP